MNELDKIVSLASEIEIAQKDADIVTCVEEAKYYLDKVLPQLYDELHVNYVKLVKKLYETHKHTEYRYQLEPFNE